MSYLENGYDIFFRRVVVSDSRVYSAADYESLFEDESVNTYSVINNAITNSKISNMSVDKLTSGQLSVTTTLDIGSVGSGNYIRDDGGNVRTIMYRNGIPQLVIGNVNATGS